MSHTDLNQRLAEAIGWDRQDIAHCGDVVAVRRDRAAPYWTVFDYRDAQTIWPIAKKFRVFPSDFDDGHGGVSHWECIYAEPISGMSAKWHDVSAPCPELAVALAVVEIATLRKLKPGLRWEKFA
jgi:hypothetical protein